MFCGWRPSGLPFRTFRNFIQRLQKQHRERTGRALMSTPAPGATRGAPPPASVAACILDAAQRQNVLRSSSGSSHTHAQTGRIPVHTCCGCLGRCPGTPLRHHSLFARSSRRTVCPSPSQTPETGRRGAVMQCRWNAHKGAARTRNAPGLLPCSRRAWRGGRTCSQ
jgi:hypothetical protein